MNSSNNLMTVFFSMGIFALVIILMIYGKSILLPLVIAFFIWYVINALASLACKIRIAEHVLSESQSLFLMSLLLLVISVLIIDVVKTSVIELLHSFPDITAQLKTEIMQLADKFHISSTSIRAMLEHLSTQGTNLLSDLTHSLAETGETMATVFIYLAFLFAEQHTFSKKMAGLFTDNHRYQSFKNSLDKIDAAIKSYLWIKTLAGIIAGVSALIVFELVDLKFAFFFAAVIVLMNFIPIIGAIIGMLFPVIMALVQFETLTPCVIIIVGLSMFGFFVGNVFEPRMMGKTMNLSPLAILLALAIFGTLWGVTGMIVSVPITVTIMIASATFSHTRGIAVLLSEKGEVAR